MLLKRIGIVATRKYLQHQAPFIIFSNRIQKFSSINKQPIRFYNTKKVIPEVLTTEQPKHKKQSVGSIDSTEELRAIKPKITVLGVGGAGCSAVSNMVESKLTGVEFIACNTDVQSLSISKAPIAIHLGPKTSQGIGAGSRAEVGAKAAEESLDLVMQYVRGSHMMFLTCGLGGGTGTGALPVIGKRAREEGILTVAVVTKPFEFEGEFRKRTANKGLEQLKHCVDTLLVIPNDKLLEQTDEQISLIHAFKKVDQVLYNAIKCVTDLMFVKGHINLDFGDVYSVMKDRGRAIMGVGEYEGEADGDTRAIIAAERAIYNPFLEEVSLRTCKGAIVNIVGGTDMTLQEINAAMNRIRDDVDSEANIIFGTGTDTTMNGKIRVSIIATGVEFLNV